MDVHGPGIGSGPSSTSVQRVSGDLAIDAAGGSRSPVHALPAGTSRRRSIDRGHRVERVGRVRPGRESPACAEGTPVHLNGGARAARLSRAAAIMRSWTRHYDPGVPTTLAPYPDKTLVDYLREHATSNPGAAAIL